MRPPRRARPGCWVVPALLAASVATGQPKPPAPTLPPAPGLDLLDFPPAIARGGELTFGFEDSPEGWRSLDDGPGPVVEGETAKVGKGALRYDYPVRQGVFSAAFRGGLSVAEAKSLSFWVRAPRPVILGLAIFEEDRSCYLATSRVESAQWQRMVFDLAELRLIAGATDENHELDVEQIELIGLTDLDVLLVQGGGERGTRTLWVDEVAFSSRSVLPPIENGRELIDDFEETASRWAAVQLSGQEGVTLAEPDALRLAQGEGEAKLGRGALLYEYPSPAQRVGVLLASRPIRSESPMSIGAWMKARAPTVILWMLLEQDGSAYVAVVPLTSREWQHVQLPLSAFTLARQAEDENGRLDTRQVSALGFLDAAALLGVSAGGTSRRLWIDELVVSEELPPAETTTRDVDGGVEVVVDDFESGPAAWLSATLTELLTGKPRLVQDPKDTLSQVAEAPAIGEGCLRAQYAVPRWSLVAFLRFLQGMPFDGATHLKFWAKSQCNARFLLQLAETDESAYNRLLDLDGDEKWRRYELPLSEFELARDKVDENGRLDADQLSHLLVLELSGATGQPDPNTLWLDDVVFFVPEAG